MKEVPAGIPGRRAAWLAPALVALATIAVFSGALRNGFVNWDDNVNFLTNPHYRGLGWANLRWMFTTLLLGHYQPLTWLSFALDHLFWGMDPFGYHLTNILLHAANAALFYAVAYWLISRLSAPPAGRRAIPPRLAAVLAALLFAVHPLRVESVAWATERKDVLSGFFYLAAVYAYLRWHEAAGRPAGNWRAVCWSAFAAALLAKSMAATLPVVLLIMDIYPLRRLPAEPGRWFAGKSRSVWREKTPFLVLVAVTATVEYMAESRADAIAIAGAAARGAKACYGLIFYLWKTIWPAGLSPLYEDPLRLDPLAWPFPACAALVVLITGSLFLFRRRWPAGLAAWVCYAATLAPVLGLVSFGAQLVADRYSYLSCLPWPLLAASGLAWAWPRSRPWGRILLGWGTGLALAGLSVLTWRQLHVWHDSETLWRYTMALRPGSYLARHNLGGTLDEQGRLEEAIALYRQALRILPTHAESHYGWGRDLDIAGRTEEAIAHYREALRLKPGCVEARSDLGLALAEQGKTDEAVAQFRAALELKPDDAVTHSNLGKALAGLGRWEEAASHLHAAARLQPGLAEAHFNLGDVLLAQGRLEEARRELQEALRLDPNNGLARRKLSLLDRLGRGPRRPGG